jgi:phage terminase large subunit
VVYWAPGQAPIEGRTNIFVLDWSEHPAKTHEWFERLRRRPSQKACNIFSRKRLSEIGPLRVEGAIIPAEWVRAAIDAQDRLHFCDDGFGALGSMLRMAAAT